MKHTNPKSELAWQLHHYVLAEVEPPARIVSNPELTEGEMMTADEIEEFIKDSIATLRILNDHKSKRYEELVDIYKADLAYLASVGSLDEDDYLELIDPANLHF